MLAKVSSEQKSFATVGAAVRFAGGVDLLVFTQSRFVEEAFAAAVADVRPRLGMLLLMLMQVCQLCKLCLAGFTNMRAQRHYFGDCRRSGVDGVKTFMCLNFIPASECSFTVCTGELRESRVGSES